MLPSNEYITNVHHLPISYLNIHVSLSLGKGCVGNRPH